MSSNQAKTKQSDEKVMMNASVYKAIENECEAIAKFLKNNVKLRPTLLDQTVEKEGEGKQKVDMPIDYCLGKDLHLTVLMHKKEILPMAKEIQNKRDLRGLERIDDSMALLSFIKHFKKLVKLRPSRLLYANPNASDAKRPKRVEVMPEA